MQFLQIMKIAIFISLIQPTQWDLSVLFIKSSLHTLMSFRKAVPNSARITGTHKTSLGYLFCLLFYKKSLRQYNLHRTSVDELFSHHCFLFLVSEILFASVLTKHVTENNIYNRETKYSSLSYVLQNEGKYIYFYFYKAIQ